MKFIFIFLFSSFSLAAPFQAKLVQSETKTIESYVHGSIETEEGIIEVPNALLIPSYKIKIPYYRLYTKSDKPKTPFFFLSGGP